MSKVKFSDGNSKMGKIPSVSLPAKKTCRECACWAKCYAAKLERLRPAVRNAYQNNLDVLLQDSESYWREVEAQIMLSRFFRFHVSGDIPNMDYLTHMVEIAERNQHCQILCFTKKYELVNKYMEHGATLIRDNLHIVFSAWPGLEMINPYAFPEAHVLFRDGTTTAREDATPCGGNCAECAVTDSGCWVLKRGEQVVFKEH